MEINASSLMATMSWMVNNNLLMLSTNQRHATLSMKNFSVLTVRDVSLGMIVELWKKSSNTSTEHNYNFTLSNIKRIYNLKIAARKRRYYWEDCRCFSKLQAVTVRALTILHTKTQKPLSLLPWLLLILQFLKLVNLQMLERSSQMMKKATSVCS